MRHGNALFALVSESHLWYASTSSESSGQVRPYIKVIGQLRSRSQ